MNCHTLAMALTQSFMEPGRPPSVGSIDHDTLPLRCHWEREEDAEECTELLQHAATSWVLQVEQAGFLPPVPDADGVVDFYLYDFAGGGGYASCSTWEDADPKDNLTGCPAYVVLSPGLNEYLPTYVAHEFNHVLQYGIDYNEPTYPVWEGLASAFEIWTFPEDVQLTIDYSFPDFQASPWAGILNRGGFLWGRHGTGWAYEYSTAIWGLHLDHHFGDGRGAAAADLWLALAQKGPNTVDVLDGLEVVTGDWREALLSLSAERILLGTTEAPVWLPQAQAPLRLTIDGAYTPLDLPIAHRPSVMPYTTGAVYVSLAGVRGPLDLRVQAAEGQWGLVVARGAELTWVAAPELRWSGDGDLIVGLVNLDHDAFATTGSFRDLSASQREVTLHITPVDDPVDTGDTAPPAESTDPLPADTGEEVEREPRDDKDERSGCATAPRPAVGWLGLWGALWSAAARRRGRHKPVVETVTVTCDLCP